MDEKMERYKRNLETKANQHKLESYTDVPYTAACLCWTQANLFGARRAMGPSVNYGVPPGYEAVDVPDNQKEWDAWYWQAKLARKPGEISAGLGPGMTNDPFAE